MCFAAGSIGKVAYVGLQHDHLESPFSEWYLALISIPLEQPPKLH